MFARSVLSAHRAVAIRAVSVPSPAAVALQRVRFASTLPSYELIKVEKKPADRTALITLNRPKQLNALCDALIKELNECTALLDKDPEVGCIVITGSERAFAAGADIKEMRPRGWVDSYMNNSLGQWADLTNIQTPVIAAVNGFALGGKWLIGSLSLT